MVDITDLTTVTSTTDDNGDVTTEAIGNLDALLKVITTQLETQFTLGRITGTDYANVYLGAIQAVIQQSVTFTLGMAKTNAEVALLTQKRITEWGQTRQTWDTTNGVVKAPNAVTTATVANGTAIMPAADSVIGRQSELFKQQAKGFLNSAKNKHMKAILDTYAVKMSVNKAGDAGTAQLQHGSTSLSSVATGEVVVTTGISTVIADGDPTTTA